ncbi:MAG: Gfo/Idh/MocA family oxidoreductase [Planctomycetes bacterium]|nr:Gfo/Idh/MocA family oxidoreductase [Planctomycetota bacterium]
MVNIGILGFGSRWESCYRPALEKLRDRIRVAAVYDPVAVRARRVAEELGAVAMGGFLAACRRKDVQAVLLLDAGWAGSAVLPLLCDERKPIYVACDVGADPRLLERLHEMAISRGVTLMPELGYRYTPAALRLQELMATRLGKPRRITVQIAEGSNRRRSSVTDSTDPPPSESTQRVVAGMGVHFIDTPQWQPAEPFAGRSEPGPPFLALVQWFDWCWYMFRLQPARVTCTRQNGEAGRRRPCHSVRIDFAASSSGRRSGVAELHVHFRLEQAVESREAESTVSTSPAIRVECESGEACLNGDKTISWAAGSQRKTETLASDRSEVEVMLDHFCRRVVGGLIPVADLNDVCRGLRLARAAADSLRTGRPVVFRSDG